jgi:hypothetical protein
METGVVAPTGVFALAALLLGWRTARGRATARRLIDAGFTACDEEAKALAVQVAEVMGGHPPAPRRTYRVGRCFKRAGGWGRVYQLARAAEHGFIAAQFAAGKLALAAVPDRADVQQQLAHVGEWA